MRNLGSNSPLILSGVSSWPWYWRFIQDPLKFLIEAERQFGPLVAFGNPVRSSSSGRRFVLAIGAQYNRQVLGQTDAFRTTGQVLNGPKGSAHRRLRGGIFKMSGAKHRLHRRLMQPAFSKPAVSSYVPKMARIIDDVIDKWRPGETLDIYREMRTLSNWVAANILFGNDNFAESIKLGQTIERWFELDSKAKQTYFPLNLPGTAFGQMLRQAKILEKEMRNAIEHHRLAPSPGGDVLSSLIRAIHTQQSGMTLEDVVAHAVILYAASFETTANVLAWTLFLVAQHPSIASDLHDEILENLDDWPPDSKKLDKLPLLDAVVRESMRLLPPVPYTFRVANFKSELGSLSLNAGDRIILSHYLTHRDREIFPRPNRFDPSRWFTTRPDPFEYIPFSAGPRLCLGITFAMTELKLTVARVMQRFGMRVVPDSRIDGIIQLTLRPRWGIPMTVQPQQREFSASPITGNIHGMVDLDV